MKKKKLLFIQHCLRGGGAERVLMKILDNLDFNRYEVDLLLLYNEGVYLSKVHPRINIRSVYPHYRGHSSLFSHLLPFRLFFELKYKKKKYDYEIAFLEGLTTKILWNSLNRSSKKIAWIHSDLLRQKGRLSSKELKAYQKTDKIICVSEDVKRALVQMAPELESKSQVIYNPIDTEEIRSSVSPSDVKHPNPTIIAVGSLYKVKGYDILIEAHRKLLEKGIMHQVHIYGEGPMQEELENRIIEAGVSETFLLKGFAPNPYTAIAHADLFVSSSRVEGFSLVIAEALILGKPVVSTRTSGPVELLENGKYGMLVEPENPDALADAIGDLLTHPDKKEHFEKMANERASFFDMKKALDEVYALFS